MEDSKFSEEVRELAREKAEFLYSLTDSNSTIIRLPTSTELNYLGRLDFEIRKCAVEQYGLTGDELETYLEEIEELRRMVMEDLRYAEPVRELGRERADFLYSLMDTNSAIIRLPTTSDLDYLGRLDFEMHKFAVEQYGLTGDELETYLEEIEELRRMVMEDFRYAERVRELGRERADFLYSLMDSNSVIIRLPTTSDLDYLGRLDFEMHKFAVEQYGLTGDELETYLEEIEGFAHLDKGMVLKEDCSMNKN